MNRTFLESIILTYAYIGVLVYTILFIYWGGGYILYDIINVIMLVSYSAIIHYIFKKPESFYSKRNLITIVLICSVLFLSLYFLLSFFYTGDTYMFGPPDSQTYTRWGYKLSKMTFNDALAETKHHWRYDDWGAFILFSSFFRFISSKYLVDIFFLIIGGVSALYLFNIGKTIMNKKYAFVASVSYSISSYSVFFYGSFLKETIMIFFIITSFYLFYMYIQNLRFIYLIGSIILTIPLLFFRPVILGFIWVSLFSFFLFTKKRGLATLIVIVFFSLLFFTIYNSMSEAAIRYTHNIDFESKQFQIGSARFAMLTSTIGALIGPFPQLLNTREYLYYVPIYGPGLLFKFLLFLPFWKGLFYCVRKRYQQVIPIYSFCIMEMIALAIVNDGLELRKALPHLPFFIMTAFWFLNNYDEEANGNIQKSSYYIWTQREYSLCVLIVFFSTLAWNLLR